MNQRRVTSFTSWMSIIFLASLVGNVAMDKETTGWAAFFILASGVIVVFWIVDLWLMANAFQFNRAPEREKELPEGAWNIVKAFPDPFFSPASHFFFVVCALDKDNQSGVYATLKLQRQMLDQESSKRITDGERPMAIVINDGIIGFKWPGTLNPVA